MIFAKVWSGQQVYGESDVLQSADISAPRMHHLLDPEDMYHKVLILQQITHLSSRLAQCMLVGSNVPKSADPSTLCKLSLQNLKTLRDAFLCLWLRHTLIHVQ